MRRALAAVAVALCASTGPFGAAMGMAHAAEPYDSQLRAALAEPGDPAFAEITAAGDPAHSGPLDAARLAAMGVTLPASVAAVMRGGALRGFSDGTHRLIELGYDLTDGAHAKTAVDAAKTIGDVSFDVPGIPGAVGRTASGAAPTAVVSFAIVNRAFLVVVAGADAGHGLALDLALQVANAAAESLAADLTTSAAGGSSDASAGDGSSSAAASGGIRKALRRDDVRLGLAALAGLLMWVLLRSSKRRAGSRRTPRTPSRSDR